MTAKPMTTPVPLPIETALWAALDILSKANVPNGNQYTAQQGFNLVLAALVHITGENNPQFDEYITSHINS